MTIVVDECLPKRLSRVLVGHDAVTVQELGFGGLSDRDLLARLDGRFEVFITIDQGLTFEQDLRDRTISVVTLAAASNTFEALEPLLPDLLAVLETLDRGGLARVGRDDAGTTT